MHIYHHATRNVRQEIWIFNLSNRAWYSSQWMVAGQRKIFLQTQVKAQSSYVDAILETTTISFHLVALASVVCPASTMMGHWQFCCCRSSPTSLGDAWSLPLTSEPTGIEISVPCWLVLFVQCSAVVPQPVLNKKILNKAWYLLDS